MAGSYPVPSTVAEAGLVSVQLPADGSMHEGIHNADQNNNQIYTAGDFFAEGVEGFVPHAGSIDQGLPKLTAALRSALSTAGCASVAELQERAVLEPVSPAGLGDSGVRAMTADALPIAYASQRA